MNSLSAQEWLSALRAFSLSHSLLSDCVRRFLLQDFVGNLGFLVGNGTVSHCVPEEIGSAIGRCARSDTVARVARSSDPRKNSTIRRPAATRKRCMQRRRLVKSGAKFNTRRY
jgi:hypothetical protein